MKWKISSFFLGLLSATLVVLLYHSKRRESQITSFSARSLLVLIQDEESIPRARVAHIIGLMQEKGMNDLSSAVVMFDLLEKTDGNPVTNDSNVQEFIDEMVETYKGRDRPFVDNL